MKSHKINGLKSIFIGFLTGYLSIVIYLLVDYSPNEGEYFSFSYIIYKIHLLFFLANIMPFICMTVDYWVFFPLIFFFGLWLQLKTIPKKYMTFVVGGNYCIWLFIGMWLTNITSA